MPVVRCMVGVNALAQAKYAKGAAENCRREGNDAGSAFSGMARTPGPSSWGSFLLPPVPTKRRI